MFQKICARFSFFLFVISLPIEKQTIFIVPINITIMVKIVRVISPDLQQSFVYCASCFRNYMIRFFRTTAIAVREQQILFGPLIYPNISTMHYSSQTNSISSQELLWSHATICYYVFAARHDDLSLLSLQPPGHSQFV